MKRTMVSNKIWRTIVVAGAMLATPLAACGGSDKKADTAPAPAPTATETTPSAADDPDAKGITAEDAAAQAKFEEEEARKAEEARIAEEKAAAEAQAAKEAEEKAAAEEAAKKEAESKKARPRTTKSRPSGRGFILS